MQPKDAKLKAEMKAKMLLRDVSTHGALLAVEEVVANTHELKRRQETPDAPEALSCVPALKLSDIPKTVTKVCFRQAGGLLLQKGNPGLHESCQKHAESVKISAAIQLQ
eukprot:1162133-Pelagomonas_calceolata.AAC.2